MFLRNFSPLLTFATVWMLYSGITFYLATSIYEVYPSANKAVILVPLSGFQMAFLLTWLVVLIVREL